MSGTPHRTAPELVKWTDQKGREHDVPRAVASALELPFRGQKLTGSSLLVMEFFTEEPVLEALNKITASPSKLSQVSFWCQVVNQNSQQS